MKAELERLDGRLVNRVDVVPHGVLGVADADGAASVAEPATLRFFGRVESYKGLRYLLDANDILRRRGHAPRLIIAGTGQDLERHRARLAESPNVELIDRYVLPTEVPRLFRRSTAVVLPYTDATQSGVATIALGNARPVIATAVGDLPDAVIHGQTGLIVPPSDAESLADAMQALIRDRALCSSLAAGADRHGRETLSWSRIAEATERAYARAIAAHAGRVTRVSVVDEST
jgi:glycosyltransferase involved in cell wall biosynthesis